MAPEIYDFYPSKAATGEKAILSIPHAGLEIPPEFIDKIVEDPRVQNQDVDFQVQDLIDIADLNALGAHVLVAKIHRVCVDLNRPEARAVMNWKENSKGQRLVQQEFSDLDRKRMIEKYYRPYYEKAESLINSNDILFVDLHSMPSRATAYHLSKNPNQPIERPEVCLSDQKGKTLPPECMGFLKQAFEKQGVQVNVNDPYLGGNITTHFGLKVRRAVQIETNRSLYMDEEKQELIPKKLESYRQKLTGVLSDYIQEFS